MFLVNQQKKFTKNEWHAKLVKCQMAHKQRNVTEYGRDIRLGIIRSRRALGMMKRATSRRKRRIEENKMCRILGWKKYSDYLQARRPFWSTKIALCPEERIM